MTIDIQLRNEEADDHESIYDLTREAFLGRPYAGGDEQDVVNRLRRASALSLSLVAIKDGTLIGQATFSPAVQADGSSGWYALGPISVQPKWQGEGVGAALIEAGMKHLRSVDARGCILTGDPGYYSRFDFVVSPGYCPDNEPGEFFQLRLLSDHSPGGKFAFHPAFYGDE